MQNRPGEGLCPLLRLIIPIVDGLVLAVFGAIAVSSDVFMEEMGVGNDPGILGNGECVIENHLVVSQHDYDGLA